MTGSRLLLSSLLSGVMAWTCLPTAPETPDGDARIDEPGTAVAADASATGASVGIWLRGPFGRVRGGSLDEPAAEAPLAAPLDTFVRRAPLVLETDQAGGRWLQEVTAIPVGAEQPAEVLSTGALSFEGPDRPGTARIVARLAGDPGPITSVAWLVEVPDREPPADGLYDIPAPEIIVGSGQGEASGLAASGCYAYLCVDVGPLPPTDSVDTLPVRVGEVLTLRLGDGSAVSAWEGTLSAIGQDGGPSRHASGVVPVAQAAPLELGGLEAPAQGGWLLTLKVVFDRERGWLWTTIRLAAE